MLFIEYVITQGRADPSVVYRVGTSVHTLGTANGFQIFDDNDELVFRSWEKIKLPISQFRLRLLGDDLSRASA